MRAADLIVCDVTQKTFLIGVSVSVIQYTPRGRVGKSYPWDFPRRFTVTGGPYKRAILDSGGYYDTKQMDSENTRLQNKDFYKVRFLQWSIRHRHLLHNLSLYEF